MDNSTYSCKEKIPGIRLATQEQCAALIIQICHKFTAHIPSIYCTTTRCQTRCYITSNKLHF